MTQKYISKAEFIEAYKNIQNPLASGKTREKAVGLIEKYDFPTRKNEDWTKTDVLPILKHKFEYGKKTEIDKTIVSMYNVSGSYANVLVFLNGHFCKELSRFTDSAEKFDFMNMASAKENESEIFQKYFDKTLVSEKNLFTAVNTAYAEDGAFIRIKRNQKVENPVHVYFFTDGNNRKITSLLRNLVIAEQGSDAHIVFSYHSLSEDYVLTNVVTEIFTEANSKIDFNVFQGEGDDAFQINHTSIWQKRDSNFYANTLTMCGSIVRNDMHVKLAEENTYAELNGLYLPDREQHFDNTLFVEHSVGNTLSRQFYRGIVENNATAVFYGKVLIAEKAAGSEAHQANNNILLSKHAKVHSKPHLIIHNDDVAASHGSTVGQLDKDALFYMQARGIGEKRAKTLLLTAFAREIIDKIQIPQFHYYVKFLVEKRMKGEKTDGMCSQMGVCRG